MSLKTWRVAFAGCVLSFLALCAPSFAEDKPSVPSEEPAKSGNLQDYLAGGESSTPESNEYITFDVKDKDLNEVLRFIMMTLEAYRLFGLVDVRLRLGTAPEKAIGDPEVWRHAESALSSAMERSSLPYTLEEGEGAFYGPKVDVLVRDALGREIQLGTVQLDFNFPERFDLHYIASDGTDKRPVMIHRAMLGSIERFLGILIEHCAGAFPFWIAPVQVAILPVTDRAADYAGRVRDQLRQEGFRVEVDLRNEKIGAKIRLAQIHKVPFMLVVGDREVAAGTVSVRHRSEGDQGARTLEEFVQTARQLRSSRAVR